MKVTMSALALALLVAPAGCAPVERQGEMGTTGATRDAEREAQRAGQSEGQMGASAELVTEEQDGSSVTLVVGGELTVALRGNRSTPYRWEVMETPAPLRAAGEDYEQDPAPAGMVGQGGTEKFQFQAVAPGRGRVRLAYRGLSASGSPPERTWQIDVLVVR